jgi:hypothetical protein
MRIYLASIFLMCTLVSLPCIHSESNVSYLMFRYLILDLLDEHTISEGSKIQDFSKCIQNTLNHDLHSLTKDGMKVLDPSFITLLHNMRFIIKFLLFWKTKLFKENTELRNCLQVGLFLEI